MRDVEDLVHGWSGELSTKEWPEETQNSEEGALTAAVRAGNDGVHSLLNLQRD